MTQPAASTQKTPADLMPSLILCAQVVSRKGGREFPLYWFKVPFTDETRDETFVARFRTVLHELLVDPLLEELWLNEPQDRDEWINIWRKNGFRFVAEKQFQPGVTDNLSHTVEEALRLRELPAGIQAASGRLFLFSGEEDQRKSVKQIEELSRYVLYHPLTERLKVHDLKEGTTESKALLSFPQISLPEPSPVTPVSLDLPDEDLERLSRERLLALTLDEMKAIRRHFRQVSVQEMRRQLGLPEPPTDVELEVLAQTWSEHCKHKIFNATIVHTDTSKGPGEKRQVIQSLYKTYIQSATRELSAWRPDLLSVFVDNAGVVKWDDESAVCFKVETHNSPSALEPYGGALTGILGVNRDILGTGLGARPIFNTDVFCFAYPGEGLARHQKLLPPKTILDGVRKGVEDGGNKSGIPTVNGAIVFDAGYRAKPLVFCGTGGILPLRAPVAGKEEAAYLKHAQTGDTIVMVGGRVGKDGIHGATFSSESLHEGSPVSAVQIGDPFTQKRVLDFTIEARDAGLITSLTDNGAGGLSSSVGEMARTTNGASIELDAVKTKYPGLSDWEIVVSESQERMTIATRDFEALEKIALKHNVEISNIGEFHDRGYFEVTRSGKPVALIDLSFLHDGVPTLNLESTWSPNQITMKTGRQPANLGRVLLNLLSHPNICSREPIIRQYDHEVQGTSVIKPLMGVRQKAPCDAAVIAPVYGSKSGLVISNGIAPRLSEHDTYIMAVAAVDEAVRNAVCVGADPETLCLLDNFCFPDPVYSDKNPNGKRILAQLVRACQGLFDAVHAYKAPLISGKDSMKNNFEDGALKLAIPPTLLISLIGKIKNIENAVSMDFKSPGDLIYMIAAGTLGLAGSHYEELEGWQSTIMPSPDLDTACVLYHKLNTAIKNRWVRSAHDVSDGGLAVALSESVIGSDCGAAIDLSSYSAFVRRRYESKSSLAMRSLEILIRTDSLLFAEGPGHIVVSIEPRYADDFERLFEAGTCFKLGTVTKERHLRIDAPLPSGLETVIHTSAEALEKAWEAELPFD